MKRPLRFAIVFAVALAFVLFLPLYVERTMTHVMFVHGGGLSSGAGSFAR